MTLDTPDLRVQEKFPLELNKLGPTLEPTGRSQAHLIRVTFPKGNTFLKRKQPTQGWDKEQ